MLDRSANTEEHPEVDAERPDEVSVRPERAGGRGLRSLLRQFWQFLVAQSSSSLTRRIVSLNVAGLLALVIGILYLSQFRAGLIDARAQSLLVQGEIIAAAIAASATGDTEPGTITVDPDKLLELKPGESYGPPEDVLFAYEFPINPERVARSCAGWCRRPIPARGSMTARAF